MKYVMPTMQSCPTCTVRNDSLCSIQLQDHNTFRVVVVLRRALSRGLCALWLRSTPASGGQVVSPSEAGQRAGIAID